MKLIAKKPCSFGGKKFYIGDEIPAEYVLNPNDQEKMGVLATVDDQGHPAPEFHEETAASGITITLHAEEGDLPLNPTAEGLQAVFDVLTGKPTEAEAIIGKMTDDDSLILLHAADSRKAVMAMAENRAKALNTEESAGEQ